LPGYLPVDGHDVHVALTEMDRRIRAMYPGRLGERALMGYSMGGMHTMFLAADPQTNAVPLLRFDRYVAISSPVRMMHGVSMLDEYYRAPLDWPSTERTDNLENTFLKVAAMSKTTMTPQTSLPFNAIESRFLIGLTFRLILRDVIFDTQRRNNQGVLDHSIRNLRREPVYQEILQYSYQDYFEKFVTPYYQGRGLASPAVETLEKGGDLRTYGAALGANPDLRVIVNQNDFLLADEDLTWLRTTVAPERLTVFNKGGHMGNLSNTNVQTSILGALKGLNAVPLPASGR
ncbi:MAG TPA: hypothetical protein VK968_12345, partial [Roseimicrobium sp.]|nr:hypothetical protein [Roseimicrobium sp.]